MRTVFDGQDRRIGTPRTQFDELKSIYDETILAQPTGEGSRTRQQRVLTRMGTQFGNMLESDRRDVERISELVTKAGAIVPSEGGTGISGSTNPVVAVIRAQLQTARAATDTAIKERDDESEKVASLETDLDTTRADLEAANTAKNTEETRNAELQVNLTTQSERASRLYTAALDMLQHENERYRSWSSTQGRLLREPIEDNARQPTRTALLRGGQRRNFASADVEHAQEAWAIMIRDAYSETRSAMTRIQTA